MEGKSKKFSGAFLVASGIFLSRIFGFIRERVFAHYFGNSMYADAFRAAFRIPNLIQNLFGEGVLSASFIPVYSKLIKEGEKEEARNLAYSILNILCLVVFIIVILGVLNSENLVNLIAPGFVGEKRSLTISLTSILFVATGILAASAWCLGVLNSHHNFFISYSSPVFWNLCIIIILIIYGSKYTQNDLITVCAYAVVLGSLLQLLYQLSPVIKYLGRYLFIFDIASSSVKKVLVNFLPVVMGRGVVQFSAYIDNLLASLLATGSVSALSYMQIVFTLPISLFGMSVSASELPQMSQLLGEDQEVKKNLKSRLTKASSQIAYFIIPSTVCFLFLGDLIIYTIFQTGNFKLYDTYLVYIILAAASLSLYPSTQSRLLASTFFAMHNTKTPFYISLFRVCISTTMGVVSVLYLPKLFPNQILPIGLIFLVLSSGIGSIIEFFILKRKIQNVLGKIDFPLIKELKLWLIALICAVGCRAMFLEYLDYSLFNNVLVLSVFGVSYLILSFLIKAEEASSLFRKLKIIK